jgi:hypothetical protein
MGEVLDIIREGIKVNVEFDTESAVILGVVAFLALFFALALYGTFFK